MQKFAFSGDFEILARRAAPAPKISKILTRRAAPSAGNFEILACRAAPAPLNFAKFRTLLNTSSLRNLIFKWFFERNST